MSHTPKTAALLALADGALSDAGRARIERHLSACDVCQRELAAIRAYDQAVDEAREAEAPEVDFARMDAALSREAERLSVEIQIKKKRPSYAWVALAAAAAVLLALFVAWPAAAPAPVTEHRPEPVAPPESPRLTPTVTLAAGQAHKIGRPAVALEPGDVLAEGDQLQIGADGVVHVMLSDGTGFVASASTDLGITRAREDAVELELTAGRVSNTVATLRSGSTYAILAAGYRVEVRGTRFVVSYLEDIVGVDLTEGTVVVTTPTGEEIDLAAPARWRSSGIDGDTSEPEAAIPPRAMGGTDVRLEHAEIARWEVDGTTVDTAGPVLLRLAPGEHRVRGWDLGDRAFTALLRVEREPAFLSEGQLEPEAPRLRPGHLDEADITRVMQQGRGQIARCHERAMRLRPDVRPPSMRLRIFVGLLGEVRRVQLVGGEEAAPELRECIVRYAESWTFPPPGGTVPPIELPLTFSARQ